MRFATEKQQVTEGEAMDSPAAGRPAFQQALRELENDISGWEAEVQQLRAKITKARKTYEMLRSYQTSHEAPHQNEPDFAPRQRTRRDSEAWRIRQAAYRALVRAGRPLSSAELLQSLTQEGLTIEGPKPGNKIYRTLWNAKDEFVRTDDGFVLAPPPPASRGDGDLQPASKTPRK